MVDVRCRVVAHLALLVFDPDVAELDVDPDFLDRFAQSGAGFLPIGIKDVQDVQEEIIS